MNDAMQSAPWAITPWKVDQAVQRLIEAGHPRKVILFGSYARGEVHRDSDLDVLVVTNDAVPNVRKESARLRHALRGIHLCVDVLAVREGDFNRLKDKIGLIYREALRHGTVVYDAGQCV
jgi:predicted nucleotidyltransferase